MAWNLVRNAQSHGAQLEYTDENLSEATLPDCPACVYGTLVPHDDKQLEWECIDCSFIFETRFLQDLKILPSRRILGAPFIHHGKYFVPQPKQP